MQTWHVPCSRRNPGLCQGRDWPGERSRAHRGIRSGPARRGSARFPSAWPKSCRPFSRPCRPLPTIHVQQRKHLSRASSTCHSPPGLNRGFLFHHFQQRRVSGLRCSETRPVPTFHALPCFQANDFFCNCSGARQLVTSSRADRMRKQGTGVGVEGIVRDSPPRMTSSEQSEKCPSRL